MSETEKTQSSRRTWVRDLAENMPVETTFCVAASGLALDKHGKAFMTLSLADRTGTVEGKVWENVQATAAVLKTGTVMMIKGKCQVFQGRRQVVVKSVTPIDTQTIDWKDFRTEKALDINSLLSKLHGFIDSMSDPHLRALCAVTFLEDSDVVDRIKRAPAAKSIHHAYPGGLLEHMVSVATLCDLIAHHYRPYLDRDLLLVGAFFHDVAKIWELDYTKLTEYTDEGRLIGHLVMGVELIDRKIRALESDTARGLGPFPEERRLLAKHMVVAHHGRLDYGSPKEPHVLEALIVHALDDLDSKFAQIRDYLEKDESHGNWTQLHRLFERAFYKPDWARRS